MSNTITRLTIDVANNTKVVLPEGFNKLLGKDLALLTPLPTSLLRALGLPSTTPVLEAGKIVGAEMSAIATAYTGAYIGYAAEARAAELLAAAGKTAIGWTVPGPGNLTQLFLRWAAEVAERIKVEPKPMLRELGGRGDYLRFVNILKLMASLPFRSHGSLYGFPVNGDQLKALALICVALHDGRPQDLLFQQEEADDLADVDARAAAKNGWAQFTVPSQPYGALGPLAAANMAAFSGHVTLRFKQTQLPVIEVAQAEAIVVAHAIERDLKKGLCHVTHDQLKNSSVGQGLRGVWLKDGVIKTLVGAGSKPEKCANRQKLVLGTQALMAGTVASNLQLETEAGTLPVTVGHKATVTLTNWAAHGSGQTFSNPSFKLSAWVDAWIHTELLPEEVEAVQASIPPIGSSFGPDEVVVPDHVYTLDTDQVVVLGEAKIEQDEFTKGWWLRTRLERHVTDYNGFKLKGLGLKGSMMPLETISGETDLWQTFGTDLVINLEAAKGNALTLALWAETLDQPLIIGADDLSAEQQAAYEAWFDRSVRTQVIRHQIDSSLLPVFQANGITTVQEDGHWFAEQNVEFLQGEMVVELEAPIVHHRVTRGSLGLLAASLISAEL